MLEISPISAFSDNYIWLLRDTARGTAFVVDPGDAQPVLDALQAQDLTLKGILITHHHFDHVGGLEVLREAYNPVVYGPRNPGIAGLDHTLGDGDEIEVMGRRWQVLEVPGHTLDHIAYFSEAESGEHPVLFCGDTLFAGGCGRVFEGDPPMMHGSLQKLAALPVSTLIYCAHEYTLGNLAFAEAADPENSALKSRVAAARTTRERGQPTVPSSMELELATNPFLRCSNADVVANLRQQQRLIGDDPSAVFAAVRGWKDSF